MNDLCEYPSAKKGTACIKCGRVLAMDFHVAPARQCTIYKRNGLGDILERELTRMGITQNRYKEIKEKFGYPPTCGCEKRKQWLNKVGRYIGI